MHEAPVVRPTVVGRISAGVGALAVAAMALMTLLGIASRVFRIGALAGANELTGYFLGLCALGGAAYTFEQGRFVRVRWALDKYVGAARPVLHRIAVLAALACVLAYTLGVLKLAVEAFRLQTRAIGVLNLPLAVPLGVFVLGLAGLGITIWTSRRHG